MAAERAARDRAHMRRALALARRGWGWTAPNPMVGAVVVGADGQVIAEGWHDRWGEPHAEAAALAAAGARARGATVYVTLEPCTHHGKTPPCADALIAAGVARVVVAARDPNPVAAGGIERLERAGIAVTTGVEERAARELNAPFFHAYSHERPWVTLKLALSIDGAIADASGRARWLTGERSRRLVHRLRAGSDAVAVGIGTVLADDPSLTVRHAPAPRVPPRRVVFDREARLPLASTLVRTAREVPTTVVAGPAPAADRVRCLIDAGVDVLTAPTLEQGLELLRSAHDVRALLVEGGSRVASALLAAAAVDRLIIFRAPVLLGAGALPAFAGAPAWPVDAAPRWTVLERRTLGADTMTVYAPPERHAGD